MASTKSKSPVAKTTTKTTDKKLSSVKKVIKKVVAAITTKGRAIAKKAPEQKPVQKATPTAKAKASTKPSGKISAGKDPKTKEESAKPANKKVSATKMTATKPLSNKDVVSAAVAVDTPKKRDQKTNTKRDTLAKKPSKPSAIDKIMESSDIDMRMFAPPRPLEAKSDQSISDDEMATLREMEATQEAIDRVRQQAIIKPPEDFDGENCVACGLEIEKRRLNLGYYTCIDCERKKELTAKLFRR